MAIPPRRRRAGKIEIDNKNRLVRKEEKKEITPEEEAERIRILKEAGLLYKSDRKHDS
ncbi:hypothetical protein J4461_00665 [Candidatus Pacearchaeota archaeon]|nr:hypothetical protein [Candidatus Pacearchaeota archaeon]